MSDRRLIAVSLAAMAVFEILGIAIARFASGFEWSLAVVAALPGPIVLAILCAALLRMRRGAA